jgi:hypothetical protein
MPSPFQYFRKRQKVLLAVFGVALIIVFTVGSTALMYMGRSSGRPTQAETVVTFKGGSLTQNQLDQIRWEHNMLLAFFQEVAERTSRVGGSPGRPLIETGDSDRELLYNHLLAGQAGELGIVVTDEAVNEYLLQFSDRKLPPSQFGSILETRLDGRISEATLFDAIRRHIAAKSMQDMITSGLASVSPGLGQEFAVEPSRVWEYYGQLNREITAEVMSVDVAEYVDKVAPPSEEQVLELYEKYKERFPFPDSPEPGFKQPHKIKLAYVVGDFNKFLEEEKTKIPAEDIKKHYEENRDDFRKPELPPEQPEEEETAEDGDPDAAADTESDTTDAPATDEEAETADGDGSAPNGDASEAPSKTDDEPAATDEDATEESDENSEAGTAEVPKPTEPDTSDTSGEETDEPAGAAGAENETTPPDTAEEADTKEGSETDAASETSPEEVDAPESSNADSSEGAHLESPTKIGSPGVFVAYFDDTADDGDTAEEAGEEGGQEPAATDESPTANGADSADTEAGTADDAGPVGEGNEPVKEEAAAAEEVTGDVEDPASQPPEKAKDGEATAAESPDAKDKETGTADTDAGDPAAETSSAEDAPDKAPAGEKLEETSSDETSKESTGGDPVAEGDTTEAGEVAEGAGEEEKPVEYRPLEEVRDEIAGRLAKPTAQERFDRALSLIRSEMDDYYQDLALWEALQEDRDSGDTASRPEPPDVKALAKENGLTDDSTKLVDVLEFAEYDIGKAEQTYYQIQRRPDGTIMPREQKVRLVADAFGNGVPLFQAKRFPGRKTGPGMFPAGNADTQYVYWKTKDREEYVPELDEIRDEVVKAWKFDKARELARQAAEKQAEKARKSGVSLASEFGEDKVIETDAFRYFDPLSVGNAREGLGRLQVSTIDGVDGVGDDFMRTVFDHTAGDVCVTLNEPETTAYVVRLKTDRPNDEVLRDRFKISVTMNPRAQLPQEIQLLAARDVGRYFRSWLDEFDEEMEIDWKREPQLGSQQGRM